MLSDKQLLRYMRAGTSQKRLDDVIDEFWFMNDCYLAIEEAAPTLYAAENHLVQSRDEAQDLLDMVWPKIGEFIPTKEVEEPSLIMYKNPLEFAVAATWGRFPKNSMLPLIIGGIDGIMFGSRMYGDLPQMALPFGLAVGMAGAGLGIGMVGAVRIYQGHIVNGIMYFPDPQYIYVRQTSKAGMCMTIAHEATHSVHAQTLGFLGCMKNLFGYRCVTEGIAEVIAYHAVMLLDPSKGLFCRGVPINRSLGSLVDAREYMRVERKKNPYSVGFTGIELMRREAGNDVLAQIIRGKDFDI